MGTDVELPIIDPAEVPYGIPPEVGLPIMLLGVVVSDPGQPTTANASSTMTAATSSVVVRPLPFISPPFVRPQPVRRFEQYFPERQYPSVGRLNPALHSA
jgi:hypothetical protein